MPAKERTREHHRLRHHDRGGLQENMEIGRERGGLRLEKRLRPYPAGAAVIVVTGNEQHREPQSADRGAGSGDKCLGRCWRIKHVAGHHDKGGLMFPGGLADPIDHIEPGLLEAVAIGCIGYAGKWLTKLPVSGVDKAGRHGGDAFGKTGKVFQKIERDEVVLAGRYSQRPATGLSWRARQ